MSVKQVKHANFSLIWAPYHALYLLQWYLYFLSNSTYFAAYEQLTAHKGTQSRSTLFGLYSSCRSSCRPKEEGKTAGETGD